MSDDVDPELIEKGSILLSQVLSKLDSLESELEALEETGLTHEDTVALIYGRRNDLNKTEIRAGFSAMESLAETSEQELIRNLLAEYSSDLNKTDAGEFVDQLYDLRRRYVDDE